MSTAVKLDGMLAAMIDSPQLGQYSPEPDEPRLRAVGWRVLVRLAQPKEKTSGGIIMPEKTAEMEALAAITGEVVGVGEHCYPRDKYPNGPWCRVGDWVIFRKYSGTPLKLNGREYRLLADDAIEAVTSVPEEIGRT